MTEDLQFKSGFGRNLLEGAQGIAEGMAGTPRRVLGPSMGEKAGLKTVLDYGQGSNDLANIGHARLGQDYDSGVNFDSGENFERDYTNNVVDSTLANMDRAHQRSLLEREGRAASVGGTSNTRAAVGNAVADNLHGMTRAQQEAQLRDEAQKWSSEMRQGAFEYDATNQQDAFEYAKNMGLDEAQVADAMAQSHLARGGDIGSALSSFGELRRGLQQEGMDAAYNAPKDAASWLASMFGNTMNGVGQGPHGSTQTTETPAPSTFSQILGGMGAVGGMLLSDERAKEEIRPMEVGLNALKDVTPATYEYKDGAPTSKTGRTAGLMAQDLEHIPGAVETGADGLKRVDPYPVLATICQAVKELDERTA